MFDRPVAILLAAPRCPAALRSRPCPSMLESTEVLLSLAEVSAAFAGFAALVSVIPRGLGQAAAPGHDVLRLRLVISSGVAGVAAALIPVALAGYLDTQWVWRISALVFLVFDNSIILSFIGAYQPVRGDFDPDRLAVTVVTALELVEQASLVTILLGLGSVAPASLYITALIANICQAGFVFVRFVGSTFDHKNAE